MNPGTSLHFDGKALEEQQEAELKQDDLKREQEVSFLLKRNERERSFGPAP